MIILQAKAEAGTSLAEGIDLEFEGHHPDSPRYEGGRSTPLKFETQAVAVGVACSVDAAGGASRKGLASP